MHVVLNTAFNINLNKQNKNLQYCDIALIRLPVCNIVILHRILQYSDIQPRCVPKFFKIIYPRLKTV